MCTSIRRIGSLCQSRLSTLYHSPLHPTESTSSVSWLQSIDPMFMEGFAPWLFTLSRRMQPISTWSPSKTRNACFPNTNTFEVTFSVFPDLFSQRVNTMSFVSNHFQSQIDLHYNYHVIGKHGSSRLIDPQLFEAISFEMTPEKLTDLSAIDCTCLFMPLTWTPIPDRLQRILIDSFRLLYT